MKEIRISRRAFLKGTGATVALLSLNSLGFLGGNQIANATEKVFEDWKYSGWEDLHREEWTWDKVTFGTHLVDCYPGNCLWRVYSKDGLVFREEQAAKYPVIDASGPDFNPRGCQKGASYSLQMYNPDRLKYPMKQTGGRGSGKWKRISWDQCLTEIAEGILDGLEKSGPESIIFENGPGNGGYVHTMGPHRLMTALGGTMLDLDSTIGDFNRGVYETFGKFQFMDSVDAWYFGKLQLIWHMNPVYTRIPSYHFISESRYNGAEVVTIAPDYSPSAMHADEYIPVEMGSDAALGLGVCQVLIEKGWVDYPFVKEQSDLPMLIRTDTDTFLTAADIEKGAREDQFCFWDSKNNKAVKAPLDTLKLPCDPALEGTYTVTLVNGKQVSVQPVFDRLKKMLNSQYTPEQASESCKTHPDTIRRLAEKCYKASGSIQVMVGWNSPKYYHGDLIERVMCLVLALTGSLGKKGCGIRGWNESLFEGAFSLIFKRKLGMVNLTQQMPILRRVWDQAKRIDPTITDEMASIEQERVIDRNLVNYTVPTFLYYEHSDYKKAWDNKAWHCPTMKRSFKEYYDEAVGKGWWDGYIKPAPDQTPTVYCWNGTNPARKNRGWVKNILGSLWQKYLLIFGFETRWSTTLLYGDYALPCAGFYEKLDTRFPTPHVPWLTLTDQAVKPVGESKPEWEISEMLAKKIEEIAKKRGKTKFIPRTPIQEEYRAFLRHFTVRDKDGNVDISDLGNWQNMGASNYEEVFDDALKTSVFLGNLPPGTDLKKMRQEGIVRFTDVSIFDPVTMNLATDIKPDEPIVPLTWHTGEKKLPYPTYNRRIQFYIDHPWFLEAKEELPVHKDTPSIGGNYPLRMTSGHQRWSVHSIWISNEQLLRTHQGRPFMFMSKEDAAKRGIADGDLVRVYNDFDSFKVHVKVTPAARPETGKAMPGQVIIYHAWEPFMFPGWKSYDAAIPGMIKWLDLVNNYGHLRYWRWNWCAQPVDRGMAVEVEKA
ncbi:MAG: molybdopterin-dependent oxidoreductase [Thermodesulfobacteriota bacterium]|nr:molybdopterin-dependent oxidoreductase [Thermodesulfobacteriota bacterium]